MVFVIPTLFIYILYPSVILVPVHGASHSFVEWIERLVAQFLFGRCDVAAPVALFHDVVFVGVYGGRFAADVRPDVAEMSDDEEQPYWCGDAQQPGVAQFVAYQVAECARIVGLSVAQRIVCAYGATVEGEECCLHQVFHIDECEVLWLVAHGKIHMSLDAFGHHEIVFLPWPVHSGWTQDDVRKSLLPVEHLFTFQFALPVGRGWLWNVVIADVGIGALFLDGSENAQTADEHKSLNRFLLLSQGFHQMLGAQCVDTEEVVTVQAFGGSGSMDDIVEMMSMQLCFQFFGVAQVELYEMYAGVFQVMPFPPKNCR